eukprot:TRINITY_DN5790_c0_g1_i1.p1 TRINITY_DN5790_c0_g1~~TRINITY_DN5790_c0_g1_i1.p1  ORF type:complete len:419 (+),score=31.21 TRINITY_DN5790_c0_g1_i1:71-1258(+)
MASKDTERISDEASNIRKYGATPACSKPKPVQLPSEQPSVLLVHGAIVVSYVLFGGGAIMGKLGVTGTNFMVFECYRETISCVVLVFYMRLRGFMLMPRLIDFRLVLLAGLSYFCNQLFWFLGIKLTDPVVGATWQSFSSILTCGIAVLLGRENFPYGAKAAGMLIALLGTVCMIASDTSQGSHGKPGLSVARTVAGHICFFMNILSCAIYLVVCKSLGQKYSPMATFTWCNIIAAVLMLFSTSTILSSDALLSLACSGSKSAVFTDCFKAGWSLLPCMCWPLVYEVVVCSLIGWPLMNWANQHTDASVVTVYVVIHPISSCLISSVLVFAWGSAWARRYDLRPAGWHSCGMILIVVGLVIVFYHEMRLRNRRLTREGDVRSSVVQSRNEIAEQI